MKKRRFMQSGELFYNYTRNLKKELGGGISDRELTDGLAAFLDNENLTPIIKRRAKKRGRWWL